MSALTAITNGWIVSMDPAVGELQNGSILINEGRIVGVGRDLAVPENAEVLDATGMIVIPGLIDSHKHLWQTALRGVVADMTLTDYFTVIREQYLSQFRAADAKIGTYAGALELIDSGTTSVLDHSHGVLTPEHGDALAEGILASGIRGVWAYGFAASATNPGSAGFTNHQQRIADAHRIRDAHFSSGHLISMGIAPSDQGRTPLDVVESELRLARDMDAVWTAHTHCPPGNIAATRGFHTLYARGYIDKRAVLSHCNEFGPDDFSLVADAGAHFSSTPDTELGYGIPSPSPYAAALAAGVNPALGTDCVTCMSSDMFGAMRQALTIARSQINAMPNFESITKQRLTTRDVFAWATIDGARALGLENSIGSLTLGKAADIVLIDGGAINLAPVLDPVASLVLHAHAGNVDTVMIDGIVRKRHGRLVDVDWVVVRDDLESSSRYLTASQSSLM